MAASSLECWLGDLCSERAGVETTLRLALFEVLLEVVDAALAKGLEFDNVLLLEPARIVAQESSEVIGLRRLYVCLTRAVTTLTVLHAEQLPADLR